MIQNVPKNETKRIEKKKKFKAFNTMTTMFHCDESDNSTNERLIAVTRLTPIPVYCFCLCFSLLWYSSCTAIPPVLPFLLVCYEGAVFLKIFCYISLSISQIIILPVSLSISFVSIYIYILKLTLILKKPASATCCC
jgi:hypothetical protein